MSLALKRATYISNRKLGWLWMIKDGVFVFSSLQVHPIKPSLLVFVVRQEPRVFCEPNKESQFIFSPCASAPLQLDTTATPLQTVAAIVAGTIGNSVLPSAKEELAAAQVHHKVATTSRAKRSAAPSYWSLSLGFGCAVGLSPLRTIIPKERVQLAEPTPTAHF